MKALLGILLLSGLVLLTGAPASAQLATAELNGRVIDSSGAVLPGVTVTATQTATGLVRTVVSDVDGNYLLSNLPTGPYRLEVALQGFKNYVQTGLVLQVGARATINATLELGSLEETVTVEAAALETFNLLNHFNWGDPQVNFNAGTFGRITTQAGAPRIMQFGIKYDF